MIGYKPKVCVDTSSIVKWFKVYFVSSDKHHLKKDLKTHMVEKGVRILTLSEVEEIEKVIGKA